MQGTLQREVSSAEFIAVGVCIEQVRSDSGQHHHLARVDK